MFELLESMAINPTVDLENIGDHNALIVDAMAVVHAIKGKWKTFGEFADDAIFVYLVTLSQQWNSTRLDFVSDRYPEISIKNAERTRRAVQGAQKVHILNKDQCVPKQWKKYLSCGKNKESLIEFLRDHWSTYVSSQLNSLECLYITSKMNATFLEVIPRLIPYYARMFLNCSVITKKRTHAYSFTLSMPWKHMIVS